MLLQSYSNYNKFIRQMEKTINREEVLSIIQSLQLIQQLKKGVLQEFCKVLKVGEGSNDLSILSSHLQNKIVDIFNQEGEVYEDYLKLPKFKTLGPELSQQLISLFNTVWRQYHKRSHKDHLAKLDIQIQELFPNLSKSEQQAFHLSSLQLFRNSGLCPRKMIKREKKDEEEHQKQSEFQIQASPPQINQNIYPYYQLQPPIAKVEPEEGVNYFFGHNKEGEFEGQPGQKPKGHPLFQVPRLPPFMFPNYYLGQPQHKMPYQKEEFNFSVNTFEKDHSTMFQNYKFIQCLCFGAEDRILKKDSFPCSICKFQYHYSCLMVESPVEQPVMCPLCILRRETPFCTVVKEPLQYNWHLQKPSSRREFTLRITEEDSKEVYEARESGLDCQIRFLKIDGMTFKHEMRRLNSLFVGQASQSEITLPELSHSEVHPISLEIVLRSDEEIDLSSKLYFFGVFLIRRRSAKDVIEELFQNGPSVGEEYYQQFMGEEGTVYVSLRNSYGPPMIHFPVRGSECQHQTVFDLKTYLDRTIQLGQDRDYLYCDVCSKQISSFKYDSLIYQSIKKNPNYDEDRPLAIQVRKGGQIQWIKNEEPEEPPPKEQPKPKLNPALFSEEDSESDQQA